MRRKNLVAGAPLMKKKKLGWSLARLDGGWTEGWVGNRQQF